MASQRSYKLVTVNSNPERAKMIVGKVIEAVKDQYTIVHAANAESELFNQNFVDEMATCSLNSHRPRSSKTIIRGDCARYCGTFLVLTGYRSRSF